MHLGVDQCLAAFQIVYQDKAGAVVVTEFFDRDETLAHLSFACAEMVSARTPGNSKRVAAFAQLLAIYIAENTRTSHRRSLIVTAAYRSHGSARSRTMSVRTWKLAELTELSPFHFSRVFKQSTGMTPLQFVIRERMLKAQQLIRETSRSLIEIALEVGYTSPSHFARVLRRTAGMAPTEFFGKNTTGAARSREQPLRSMADGPA
jgi:AraC family transcriptional regulator